MIKTVGQLKSEIKLLEALREIETAVRIFEKEGDVNIHLIDRHYLNMKCGVSLVSVKDPMYEVLKILSISMSFIKRKR